MENQNLELNHRLATLLGWTNIIDNGGALLGTPPEGEPQCRGQARVPDWTGDWRDCGPLMARYLLAVDLAQTFIMGHTDEGVQTVRANKCNSDRDEATRRAIVLAVIAKLEASR
jgi:hypothetical protein